MIYIFLEGKEAAMVYICMREGDGLVRRGAGEYEQVLRLYEGSHGVIKGCVRLPDELVTMGITCKWGIEVP